MTHKLPAPSNTLIVIPARMQSSRLPGKPLADICGEPMIVHVWRRACEAGAGQVLVAAASNEIANAIRKAGGDAILTTPSLPSGSDRVAQAVAMRDRDGTYDYVINLQGDLPSIDPGAIRAVLSPFKTWKADITTLVCKITGNDEAADTNVVKAIVSFMPGQTTAMATDFVRTLPPASPPPWWHHVGIYGYKRAALEKFVALPPSRNELDRSLEQMRALDNGMTIAAARIDITPSGVDTPQDLARARAMMAARN